MNKKISHDDDSDWSSVDSPPKGNLPQAMRSQSLPPTARVEANSSATKPYQPSDMMRSPLAMNASSKSSLGGGRGHELLPANTEVYTVSPSAAGIPILEIIRKLEEEKILTRDDRYELKEILYSEDQLRRDEVTKALQEVELNGNSRFSVRRLKAAIYQNGSGEVSSKNQQGQGVANSLLAMGSAKHGRSPVNVDNVENSSLASQSEKVKKVVPLDTKKLQVEQQDSPPPNAKVSSQPQKSTDKPPKSQRSKSNNAKDGEDENDGDGDDDPWNVQSTVSKVVGVATSYAGGGLKTGPTTATGSQAPSSRAITIPSSGSSQQSNLSNMSYSSNPANIPRHFNILQKISVRMDELFAKYSPEMLLKQRKLAVLVGSGSFNPLTRMHLRNYFLAKQYLEKHQGYIVLGSLLSPAHPNTVRERYRTVPLEIIPAPHRLVIAQLLVNNSQWLTIDPWEITRRRPMDYLALIEHTKYVLQDCYPDLDVQVFYLCKSNTVPTLSPQAIKGLNAQVITVCRIAEAELLQNSLQSVHNSKQWLHRGLVHIVEDSAILDASLDMVTSRKVRDKIKGNESIETLVGAKIQEYVQAHKLGAKLRGTEEWTQDERQLPKIASRPPEPVIPGNPRNSTASLSASSVASVVSVNTTGQSSNYVPSWNANNVKALGEKRCLMGLAAVRCCVDFQ